MWKKVSNFASSILLPFFYSTISISLILLYQILSWSPLSCSSLTTSSCSYSGLNWH